MAPSVDTEGMLPELLFAAVTLPLCTLTPEVDTVLWIVPPRHWTFSFAVSAFEGIVMAQLANIAGHTALAVAVLFPSLYQLHTRKHRQGLVNPTHMEIIDASARVVSLLDENLLWPAGQLTLHRHHERPQTISETIERDHFLVCRMRTQGSCFKLACGQMMHHAKTVSCQRKIILIQSILIEQKAIGQERISAMNCYLVDYLNDTV